MRYSPAAYAVSFVGVMSLALVGLGIAAVVHPPFRWDLLGSAAMGWLIGQILVEVRHHRTRRTP